ncbi:hypothetical protein D9758_013622 [Tetrapyrgos nigripes]|uniref:Zn(2)-C6 fungal-type domain-containing protein n=1 Tax=Tetrapyrgos nigripes TaxID=182062 RepID=A0A8H5CP94_9AGAR|nr:hypothetical protein D9758_013622 [Tetrapyrgos nigripes]
MVASASGNLYSPLQATFEEGFQPSEDGSGVHSPSFEAQFARPHSHDFRYHDQFHYPPLIVQQTPHIDTTLEVPNANSPHVTFTSNFSLHPRNQLGTEYQLLNSPVIANLPTPGGGLLGLSHSAPQQRLPNTPSHDPMYTQQHDSQPMAAPPVVSPIERPETPPSTNHPRDRKQPSSVVIACRQCRSRKIRCDSTRPECNNCVRRSNKCEYDAVPRRRGPDKRPGTRQRSCKKRPADATAPPPPKRKKTGPGPARASETREFSPSQLKENMANSKRIPSCATQKAVDIHPSSPTAPISTSPSGLTIEEANLMKYAYDQAHTLKAPYPRLLDVNIMQCLQSRTSHTRFPSPTPLTQSRQRIWWDKFLGNYPLDDIISNVRFLFKDAGHWLTFLNIDFFERTLRDPEERVNIQPAFIYSALAMATLMRSSDIEWGSHGRDRAMAFRQSAQEELEAALGSDWLDATLAEAALILAFFETSVHPQYSDERVRSALILLDDTIRALNLTTIDSDDPDVSRFERRMVPIVAVSGSDDRDKKCSCLPPDATLPPDPHTSWSYPVPWDPSWSSLHIRDEECRRVCWSAAGLIAKYTAQCAAFNTELPDFFLTDPGNFLLLFPGEVNDRVSPTYRSVDSHSHKESVWALYCRSMLLWNFCIRMERNPMSEAEKAQFANDAWGECQFLQDSLEMHTCNLDTMVIYLTREYIYNARITVTHALRSLHGLENRGLFFNRRQAQEWIYHQQEVVKRVKLSIEHITDPHGHQLTRRPFQATWFSNQLAICLMLWKYDQSLTEILELAKSLLVPVDVMNVLWPCQLQQHHCDEMRQQLVEYCRSVGIDLPPGPEYANTAFHRRTYL